MFRFVQMGCVVVVSGCSWYSYCVIVVVVACVFSINFSHPIHSYAFTDLCVGCVSERVHVWVCA